MANMMTSSVSVSLRADNPQFVKTRREHDLLFKDVGLWGERIRVSLNNNVGVNKLVKCLRQGEKIRKVRSGSVSAIMTSNNAHESVVSEIQF